MSVTRKILQILIAVWTALCVTYHTLVFLLSAGPTDFNGKPNGWEEYTLTGLVLITIIVQLIMLPRLIKKVSGKVVLVLISSAFLAWVAGFIFYGGIGSLLVPVIYALPMILLYGGYLLISQAISTHTNKA